MDAYTFFIEDDRHAAATLEFVLASDLARAKQLAMERLIASPHHLSVVVHQSGRQVLRVTRPPRRRDDQQPGAGPGPASTA